MYEKNILSLSPFPPSSAKASKPFTTCYFPFAPRFPHGSGEQMSDNGMGEPVGCVPPASICLFLFGVSVRLVESACCVSQSILRLSWPSRVVFTWPIKYVKPPVFSPPHVQHKSLASIIIAPQGELPKFLPSSFVRNEALSFPAISWNMSFDIKSHPFPLNAWPRQMFIIFICVTADDPARGACSVNREFTDRPDQLILKANLQGKWDNCGSFDVKNIVWGGEVEQVLLQNS